MDIEEIAERAERGEDVSAHFSDTFRLVVPAHPPILVYRFQDAPPQLQQLSTNGGDEDWLAVVPPHLTEAHIGWMESGGFDTCCEYQEVPYPEMPGYLVRIGSHA